jgi:hypothetical protein
VKLRLQPAIYALVVALAVAGAVPAQAETCFGVRAGTMLGFGVQLRHDFRELNATGGFWGVRGSLDGLVIGRDFAVVAVAADLIYQTQRNSESTGFYLGFGGRYITGTAIGAPVIVSVVLGEFFLGIESSVSPSGRFFVELYPLILAYDPGPSQAFQALTLPYIFSLGWNFSF